MAGLAQLVEYVRNRFRLADAILFTGAGFSRTFRNVAGEQMPLGDDLKPLIWPICFPTEPFDERSSLQDLVDYATHRRRREVELLLQQQLTIDPDSIPQAFQDLLSLPWRRIYTLNVDNFPDALAQKFSLRRPLNVISALTRGARPGPADVLDKLEYIQLNGVIADGLDAVTFSTTRYAERLSRNDPLYSLCAADILSRPVFFIGSPLDEPPLWQHVTLRRAGHAAAVEFRRRSFVITPDIDRARRELLDRQFNVEHLPITTEEFAKQVYAIAYEVADEGFAYLQTTYGSRAPLTDVPVVSDLATSDATADSDYLMGRAPRWGDLRAGRAIEREFDLELLGHVLTKLGSPDHCGVLVVTGTAGSGKSTACMRLALTLEARSIPVGWLDNELEMPPVDIRKSMSAVRAPRLLIVDDADRYGSVVADLADQIARAPRHPLVLLVVRSGRIDRLADRLTMLRTPFDELVMPHLADTDIAALIDLLDRENRLGELKGKQRRAQVAAFEKSAGRQLLVAMLAATSGRSFEERIHDEMTGLDAESAVVYALVAIGTAVRFGLSRDEILLAAQDPTNATLNAIEQLRRRGLLVQTVRGDMQVRHRVIAEVLLESMAKDGVLESPLTRLAIAAASKVGPGSRRGSRDYRRIKTLMNHDFLTRLVRAPAALRVLTDLEPFMEWDYHYWLQRGSLELEYDHIEAAENFLGQAYSLQPSDPLVMTEYGFLRTKLGFGTANGDEARLLFEEGLDLLDDAIESRRGADPHQFHIYGRQILLWIKRPDVTGEERSAMLALALQRVEEGREAHPRDERLRNLYVDIQNLRLGFD